MPEWALYYTYAEEYHCHPQDVPQIVTAEAWERWKLLKRAKASREVWEQWRAGQAKQMTPEQKQLFDWAAIGGYE